MATRTKARTRKTKAARRRRLAPFDYTVRVIAGRVVIEGMNDGSIYGKPRQSVTFTSARGVPAFTFRATDFNRNDSRKTARKQWPFKNDEPSWPRTSFTGELKSPGLFKKAIFKYSISVGHKTPADPIIIIER